MVRGLSLMVVLSCVACTTTYNPLRDRPDYVQHVLEDVTAMLEGMANAHNADRVVVRDPTPRSGAVPDAQSGGADIAHSRDPAATRPR